MTTKIVVGLLFISSVTVHCFITNNNNNIGGGHKHIATLTTTASAASSSTTLLQPLTRACSVISSTTSALSSLSPFQLFFALPVDSEVDTDDDDADEDNNYETKLEEARREMMGSRLQLKNDNLHKKEEEEKKSEEVAAEVEDNGTYFASVETATLSEEASHDDEGNDDDDGDDKVDDGRNTNSISSSSSSTDDDSTCTSKNTIDIDTATLSKAVDTFVAVGKNVANNLKSQQESNKALDTFVAIAKDVSQDLLSVLRFSAANIITSSLPDNQRQELLQRLGSSSNSVGVLPPEKAETGEQQRASIQEEIALARAEEAALSEQQWNTEKEQIMQQMEQAANERVQNELEVQKMRLEQEQEQQRRIEEEEETGTKSNSKKIEKKELELLQEQEVEERLKLEELFEKRKNQEQELDVVENNLRLRVAAIEQQKEQFVTLSSEVETLQHKQEVTSLLSNDDGKKEKVSEENIEEEICVVHPVLGPVVADLGYKRLHFASSGALGTIPVWNRNRIYRNNRARSMAKDKKSSMEFGFPGVICLYEDENGKLSIIDGQHRVGMMSALRENINKKNNGNNKGKGSSESDDDGVAGGMFERILVEVYSEPSNKKNKSEGKSSSFVRDIFLEINKAEPVKLIDMPGVASAADRKIITDAVNSLHGQFSSMFSPSQRCRIPNVNVDNLRGSIFGANILKRHKITTSKQLVEWLFEQNASLGDEYENDKDEDGKRSLLSNKQWSKASKSNFYLGLESTWLYK